MAEKNNNSLILRELRIKMLQIPINAIIIGSEDAHFNEYVSDHDKRRQFVSNFTGSSGTALVSLNSAVLWTDSRYYLQASLELSSEWTLMGQSEDNRLTLEEYCVNYFHTGDTIGIDGQRITLSKNNSILATLRPLRINLLLLNSNNNPVDEIWNSSRYIRPPKSKDPLFIHPISYAGRTTVDKVRDIQSFIRSTGHHGYIIASLDEIAWILNLRGRDIPYNTLFESYLIITVTSLYLFVDSIKISEEVFGYLNELKKYFSLFILNYECVTTTLCNMSDKSFIIDSSKCSASLYNDCSNIMLYEQLVLPISKMKAIKNECEMKGMRNCNIRDSIAIINTIIWLKNGIERGEVIDEMDVTIKLKEFHSKSEYYICESFETISASGANGAIIHYKPSKGNCRKISKNEIFLLDCGGQYLDGTTDTTRTICFSEPSLYSKTCFTAVLKGHIQLASAVFPDKTSGNKLDILARLNLWKRGLDYGHGTGHGVGCCNVVHEGPHGIGSGLYSHSFGLTEGVVVTDEPGYYEKDNFGIRIENILEVKRYLNPYQLNSSVFSNSLLCFEPITFVPIDRSLILKEMLSNDEKNWLDSYHESCQKKLTPFIHEDSVLAWLNDACKPI